MKRVLFCLLLLVSCVSINAQTPLQEQVANAKFLITKKTVEFLSTDKKNFPDVNEYTCANCKTVNDLKAYTDSNNIKGAIDKVITPLSNTTVDITPDKWKVSLTSFAKKADDLVAGAGKEQRKKLDGYDDYKASVEKIINGVQPGDNDQTSQTTATDTTSKYNAAVLPVTNESLISTTSANWLVWLLAVVATALLVLFVLSLRKINSLREKRNEYKSKYEDLKNQVTPKDKAIAVLRQENETLAKENEAIKMDYEASEKTRAELFAEYTQLKEKKPPQTAAVKQQPVKATSPITDKPQPVVKNIKYARYADTGDGFSNSELLDKPDNETIFELTISPNNKSAEFRIADNADAQQYALSNTQFFLGKTCRYDSFPFENAGIQTEVPGTLELNASKWKIINPAKISFK